MHQVIVLLRLLSGHLRPCRREIHFGLILPFLRMDKISLIGTSHARVLPVRENQMRLAARQLHAKLTDPAVGEDRS
jgi:hypothetical protein